MILRRPWAVVADLLVAIAAGAGAAALFVFAAFASLIGGSLVAAVVLLSVTVSMALAVWRARRRPRRSEGAGTWAERIVALRRAMLSLLAVCAVGAGVAMAANLVAIKPPAQARIAASLVEHRSDFEALRDMVLADRFSSVIEGGETYAREPFLFRTPSQLGIPLERVALYRQRMKAAGCPRIDVWQDGTVVFSLASWGMANRGWRMSLMWSKEKPTPLLPTLDGFRKAKGPSDWESAYSALGDDWYAAIVW